MNPHPEQRGLLNSHFLGFLGAILLFILVVAYFFYGLQPVVSAGQQAGGSVSTSSVREFRIVRGEGFKDIAARLSRESLIKSIAVFKVFSFLTGKAQRFQPGVYELNPGMSVPDIVTLITQGGRNEVTVTIPEGSTAKDIASMLVAAGVSEGGELAAYSPAKRAVQYPYLAGITSIEGFLFPDTYRFHPDAPLDDIVDVFLDNFNRKAWPLLDDKQEWYTTLILASFLEREVPDYNDRVIVAGILTKRLAQKMPLQVDATVSYAKCDGKIQGCEGLRVTRNDLGIASPFNTYQHLGWTPTPISNPGESAIQAAHDPKASPYWYYLSAAKTKETLFSKTLDEHNLKRATYL